MRRCIAALLTVAIVLPLSITRLSAQHRTGYSGIVVFGTSLSDSGNAFALQGDAGTPPDFGLSPLGVPATPYARGGHHFSNGATWIEQFARSLGLAGSVRPAYASGSRQATNYAVGAARGCDSPGSTNVNLTDQVHAFLSDVDGVAPADALYVIEMGGNDVRDAIVAALTVLQGGGTLQAAVQAALPTLQCARQSIENEIAALYQGGARNFLVWTVPDLGLTPAIRSLGPGAMQVATFLSATFNGQMLLPTFQAMDQLFTGLDITVLDAFTLLRRINAVPADYGLTNTTSACVTTDVEPYFCQAADEYLFWDGIHPTTAVHGIVAQEAARVLAQ